MTLATPASVGTARSRLVRLAALAALLAGESDAATMLDSQLLAGVRVQTGSGEASVQTYCPVLPDEAIDPEIFVEHLGRRVYLCCRKCLKKFEADPTAYLSNMPSGYFEDVGSAIGEVATSSAGPNVGAHDDDASTQGEPDEPVHVHSEHAQADAEPTWIARIGRLHPLSVHFPIALLLAAAVVDLFAMRRRQVAAEAVVRFCVWSGAITAVAAAALGWADASGVAATYTEFDALVLAWHRWAGTTTAVFAVLALVALERFRNHGGPAWRTWSRALLFTCAMTVAGAGYLGGSLIYGWNHLFQ